MASNEYRDLGMTRRIPRRDFLNGVAIAVAGAYVTGTRTAAAPSTLQAPPGAAPYPPARTGLRGNHPEAVAGFEPIQRGTYRQFPGLDVEPANRTTSSSSRPASRGLPAPISGGARSA